MTPTEPQGDPAILCDVIHNQLLPFPLIPGIQNALILQQLPHEAGVGPCDAALLLHVIVGLFQGPAEFLHGVGDDGGRRAAHAHLAVHQALGVVLPAAGQTGG